MPRHPPHVGLDLVDDDGRRLPQRLRTHLGRLVGELRRGLAHARPARDDFCDKAGAELLEQLDLASLFSREA